MRTAADYMMYARSREGGFGILEYALLFLHLHHSDCICAYVCACMRACACVPVCATGRQRQAKKDKLVKSKRDKRSGSRGKGAG